MHSLLAKYLKRQGIKNKEELREDERPVFDKWEAMLNKDELTVEDIKKFCQAQIELVETKWADLNGDEYKKADLIPYHTVYKLLLKAIDSPRSERVALENMLNQLINK